MLTDNRINLLTVGKTAVRSTVIFTFMLITVFFLCFLTSCGNNKKLVIYDRETGETYKKFEVEEGTEFSVEFIHSVNKSPVKDIFVIRDGNIVADRTVYSAFGAGVQTEIEEGQTLEYDKDGNMVVSGFNIVFPEVKYIVGTVYDHVFCIREESISLTELCGRNAHIGIVLK